MPTTRKQNKARKSRGLGMPSDIENLDVMLGENHFNIAESEESLNSNLARRPKSTASDNFENANEETYLMLSIVRIPQVEILVLR